MHHSLFISLIGLLLSGIARAQPIQYPFSQMEAIGCKIKKSASGTLVDCSFVQLDQDDYLLFKQFEHLVQLDLSNTATTDENLTTMGVLSKVSWLNLSNTQVDRLNISNYPKLTKLQINNMLNPIDLSYLFKQLSSLTLEILELEQNDIHEIDLRGIQAKYISLYNNPLDGNVNVSNLTVTEGLNLIQNKRVSWNISGLERLKKLYLSYNQHLAEITLNGLPNLEYLDIAYNPNLTRVLTNQCVDDMVVYHQYSDELTEIVSLIKSYQFGYSTEVPRLL
ncbi:hypothetical protein DZ860_14110 [Vibrio sinensis]|uniref:Leucine-rich repeat domain-containing protein n=1 Tax=Vibrio sinensis TaxID=2302434 RepID=A0A3A6QIX0_9VIBR|nr:hypothetical protein [Vibrio sinensis]RJX70019.1 hypothetical protein DZ860_14110 [Vibrio sinensis]